MSTTTIETTAAAAATPSTRLYQVGRVVIEAPCAVRPLADWAIETPCGVGVTNNSFHTVIVSAQLVAMSPSAAQSTMQLGPVTWTLGPNKSMSIPNPPSGYDWVIVDMSESQARNIGWLVIGGLVVGTGFAGYGMYAAVANLIGWAKRRHTHDRRESP